MTGGVGESPFERVISPLVRTRCVNRVTREEKWPFTFKHTTMWALTSCQFFFFFLTSLVFHTQAGSGVGSGFGGLGPGGQA